METQPEAAKERWLREQDESRHFHIISVNEGLAITPSLYFGTRRCTYSDVMSVVTTVKPAMAFGSPSSKKPSVIGNGLKAAWVDVASSQEVVDREAEPAPATESTNAVSQYVQAPLEGDRERSKRFLARQSYALKAERDAFMGVLHGQRRKRFLQEHHAAMAIQRVYRGSLLRRRFFIIKEKLRVRKRIRVNLVKVTKGTAIITGEKDRKARLLEQQHEAVRRIQFCYKQWVARRLFDREKELLRQEKRHEKATLIQRAWRRSMCLAIVRKLRLRLLGQHRQRLASVLERLYIGYQARQRVRRIRIRRQLHASQMIQYALQRYHARKALRMQRRRRCEERQNLAAICIQCVIRGVLARERVLRMRIEEDLAIRVACTLAIQRVARGFMGRQRMRYFRVCRVYNRAINCAVHMTRIVRGFLARRRVQMLILDQDTDLLVQTVRGNTSTVIDLLDGYSIVDEPVDMTSVNVETKNNMLHLAARHDRMDILTHVLPKFIALAPHMIYATNKRGETPLELAVCHGHEKIASFLLTKTSDLFIQLATTLHTRSVRSHGARRERSLILDAARQCMGPIVTKLAVLFPRVYDGKVRDAWSKRTILHEALLLPREHHETNEESAAISERIAETVRSILSKLSMDVNAQDLVGFTPLHVAAMLGNLIAVKLLLEFGADVSLADKEGRSAWRIALLHGYEACFLEIRRKWLSDVSLGNGSATMKDEGDASMSKALTAAATAGRRRRKRVDNLHPHLAEDLVGAARAGDASRVQFLIEEFHASPNAIDPEGDGDSLLMIALREKNIALVKYLVDQAEDDLETLYVNKAGYSVTDAALQSPLLLKLLLKNGIVNPCRPLDSGKQHRTATHEAVRRGFNVREWLNGYAIMPSIFVPLLDDSGRSPLHDAAACGNTASAALLANAGLKVDQQEAVGKRTPLHEACRAGQLAVVRKLVAACPDGLWVRDAAGQLPLYDAAWAGSPECLKFLVERMKETRHDNTDRGDAFTALAQLLHEVQETRHGGADHSETGATDVVMILQNAFATGSGS